MFHSLYKEANIESNKLLLLIPDMTHRITRYELWRAGEITTITYLSLCIDFTQDRYDRQHPGQNFNKTFEMC